MVGLFVFLSVFPGMVQGAISPQERAALIALYNATNGDSWNNNSSWKGINPEPDGFSQIGTEGTWYGITVQNNQVTKIILLYNNLVGSIPPELGNLTGLDNLYLKNNQLSGTIPVELGNLNSLKNLYLNANQFSGTIPAELGNLTQLKILYLNDNYLDGPIPTSLTNLNNLYATGLDIGTNCLCATDASLISWLNTADPDWAADQSQCTTSNITVTSPNGNENWTGGDNHYITWIAPGNVCRVKIEYSIDNGSTWKTIISPTPNDGSYTWAVPNDPSTTCLVRISDAANGSPIDQSNDVFTISASPTDGITVTAPNGGDEMVVNSTNYIYWSSTGSIDNVKIEYTTDNGGTWTTIDSSTQNDGSYTWTVPYNSSTNCKVRISDAADGTPSDESDSVFTIKAPDKFITVLSPNGGETCKINSTYNITWTSSGISGKFKIDYSTTGGNPYATTIVSSTTNDGAYTWTVPNTPSSNCKVRISDAADPTTTDTSDSKFSIVSNATAPTVTTENISSVTSNSASCSGNVTSDGGAAIKARGVCWSTSPTPTTGDKWKTDNGGIGAFTINITGLTPNTTYYVRAYADNSIDDTSYGAEKSFTTTPPPPPPPTTYNLYVRYTPSTGVSITVSPDDNNGKGSGTTNFIRTYNPGQKVTLTAPQTYNGRNFLTWKVDGANKSGRTITVTMNNNHTAMAFYQADTYTLTVQSSPNNDVPITVSPNDYNNNGNGETEFFRTYTNGTIVTLTAPASHSGKDFVKWLIDGAANSNRTVSFTMDTNHTAQAVFKSTTYTLSVQSSPDPGVTITVSQPDNNENANGTTDFNRVYTSGAIVALTAPSSFDNKDFSRWTIDGNDYSDNPIQVTMNANRTAAVYYEARPPEIGVSRTELNLGYIMGSSIQPKETFTVFNSGGGTLNWTLKNEFTYLNLSTTSGTNCEVVTLIVKAKDAGYASGKYDGVIYVSAPLADNSPMEIQVNLWVKSKASPPFGDFSTPADGSIVRSSIPVTGWVLSDTGMESVKIHRQEGNSLIYIGDATFVEGARRDIEAAYPGYPMNEKAGWGYMMLTNFLPNGGNGIYQIHAVATDREGRETNLGSKTIFVDNANAVKPFGAIETPKEGGKASGDQQPNYIPEDGSTINVYVNGVNLGHPIYNIYRADIAGLFPGYANSGGAIGYFYLDTAAYEDGLHTIQWTARDGAGNSDGIGSRYFIINNACAAAGNTATATTRRTSFNTEDISQIPLNVYDPVRVSKAYHRDLLAFPETIYPNHQGMIVIETRELEPLEIRFYEQEDPNAINPGQSTLTMVSPPLAGSVLDRDKGIFYWQPGPGFIGNYRLVFLEECRGGQLNRREIQVKILPKFGKEEPDMRNKNSKKR
jgi:hypothetical protein